MADMLKITTPLVNRVDPQGGKPAPDPTTAFDLQDIQKIIKAHPQAELLKQNNGMVEQEGAPSILMNLLKDPSVTVSFLKNIFLLQEIVQLLPVNNNPISQEIERLFQTLLIRPEDIPAELKRQEDTSTVFKGELFNLLRGVILEAPKDNELRGAVANLLKSVNNYAGKADILDALANTLQFLGKSLEPSKSLSDQLLNLSARFRQQDAPARFEGLKKEVLSLLREVGNSILFSPKMQKVASITVYNLSRYNTNPDFLQESVTNLGKLLPQVQRQQLQRALGEFFAPQQLQQKKDAGIMDVLANIIGRETESASAGVLSSDKIEKIIHSLLSSPCNFTPLLHFVIPVQYEEAKAFAEIWINSNDDEEEKPEKGKDRTKDIHMLLVFDMEAVGRFEAELHAREKTIDFSLFCPPAYLDDYAEKMKTGIAAAMAGLSYRLGNVVVGKLERGRSLMDVFKSLPHKRTGVNVKI